MDAEEGEASLLDAAACLRGLTKLLVQIAEARFEALIADLPDLTEDIEEALKAVRIDGECVQLNAEADPRRSLSSQRGRGKGREGFARGQRDQSLQHLSSRLEICR